MSLDFDVSKIKNHQEVTTAYNEDGSERWHPITEALIWHTMAIGIGQITDANVSEFYSRSRLYSKLFGDPIQFYNEETEKYETRPFTATEIHNHIGLSTNVSYEAPTKWRNRLWKYEYDRFNYERKLENETKEAELKEAKAA
jgi:hypothetical protein